MKETSTRKVPNPGDAYLRIYVPPETQQQLEHIAHERNVSRGRLITQIIEQYVNESREKRDEPAHVTNEEFNVLLEEIRSVKTALNQTEERITTILTEPGRTEVERDAVAEAKAPETAARDIDIIKIRRDPRAVARTETVITAIRELEREEGAAELEKISERAAEAGLSHDEVTDEIARLLQVEEIYEPEPGSGRYLTVLRIGRK